MSSTFPYDVFLSHSAQDKQIVRSIAERLRADGLRVWFDEWEIKPGDNISAKIEQGLEQSQVLVLCMSAQAFGSDWARLESYTFRFLDPLNKIRRFIPLRLDESPIKGSLAQLSYVQWQSKIWDQEYKEILESCRPPEKIPPAEVQAAREKFQQRVLSFGHTERVRSVAFSPDNRHALSGSDDLTVRFWDVESGKCLRVFEGHIASVMSVAWSADAKQVLSGSLDRTLRLWEAGTGKCLRVFEGHTGRIWSVAWSADGKEVLSGAEDKTARLWEVGTGKCLRTFEGHTGGVWSVAWSVNGKQVLSGSDDKTVRLWDVRTGNCLRSFDGHTEAVWNVAWSPDGKYVLSGSEDKTVRLWRVGTGDCLRVFHGHSDMVWNVVWSVDGKYLVSSSKDKTIRLWELETGICLRVFEGHTDGVWSVAWSADGKQLLSGSLDKTVRLWEAVAGKCLRVFEGHTDRVLSAAWSADGKQVLSGSLDGTVQLWVAGTGNRFRVLEAGTGSVWSVAWSPDGKQALAGSADKKIRLWETGTGKCLRVFEGHTDRVCSVAWSPDGKQLLSGSFDNTIRLWEARTGKCLRVLKGHTDYVMSVVWSADGRAAISSSDDTTVRLWQAETGKCVRVFEGHTNLVRSVAQSPDGKQVLSGSLDNTVRLWETETGRCLVVFEGHTDRVLSVAWSADGKHGLSGSSDKTVRLWEVGTGKCLRVFEGHSNSIINVQFSQSRRAFSAASNGVWREWDVAEILEAPRVADLAASNVQYTNAKVLLVGDMNAGKTGLTHRLANGEWRPSDSTVGAWSTQWSLKDPRAEPGVEREIWLWDFGGQADQRLIHQLYMDRAALILLLFNADKDEVLTGLRDWLQALRRYVKDSIPHFLVAGRVDIGFKASRAKLEAFAKEHGLAYHETSAKTNEGCDKLRAEMFAAIPWEQLTKRTSPYIFKVIRDEIVKLRDEGEVLHTFKVLRELLWRRLPREPRFTDETLQTVIGLLDGPGAVKELDYGTYILLAPEWINAYAQAVIRTLRSADNDLGVLPLRSIAEGKLIYQSIGRDGTQVEMKRLKPAEERVVLAEMERQLEQRGLCLRQGDKLVFPSHCGRDRPEATEHPSVFVSYAVKGFLDDIYATLVVKLAYSESFKLKELWREAADFVTLAGEHDIGLKLSRATFSEGDISVYVGKGATEEEQVIFANYIHAHLNFTCEQVERLRYYVCPNCNTPKGNPYAMMKKLLSKKQAATTECDMCETRFSLWDHLERLFASDTVRRQVEALQAVDAVRLESRRMHRLLALEVGSRIISAVQKWVEIPGADNYGIGIELEFTDDNGKGTGKRLYLQLIAGASYLKKRTADGVEIFDIKKHWWVNYWINQPHPVMLVIGTFSEADDQVIADERMEFTDVRWMEISSVLRRESNDGKTNIKQIEFKGERLDITSVRRWRDIALFGDPWRNYSRDSLLDLLNNGDDETSRSEAARRLAAWSDDNTRDRLHLLAKSDPSAEIQLACLESLCNGWWREWEVRRMIRERIAAETNSQIQERITEAVRRARTQLSGIWEARLSDLRNSQKLPEAVPGYPAIRALRFRLRNIGPFEDTGVVELQPDVNVFLGDNAAGKTTLLRCLALASIGLAASNEVLDNVSASAYLRKGAERGSIEVVFELIPDPGAFCEELGCFAVGLAIVEGSSRFAPLDEMTIQLPDLKPNESHNSAEPLSAIRSAGASRIGFVSAYGAVRTFTESHSPDQSELKKPENEWVRSLFKHDARLVTPEIFSKLIRGDASNIDEGPQGNLSFELVSALKTALKHLFPDVSSFHAEGDHDLQLNATSLRFGELSDGYSSLLAMIGHLLRCALKHRNWSNNPTEIDGIALIDEIDLHLHPAWQVHVIHDFRQAFTNLQVIASTHSPLVIAALKRDKVLIMRRQEDGSMTIERPEFDPQGLGVAGILTSIFSLSSTIDQPTLDKITRRILLHSNRQHWTKEDELEYANLTDHLAALGFNREFTDPYFERFAIAMAKHHQATLGKLTPNEKRELDDYADRLLANLKGDNRK